MPPQDSEQFRWFAHHVQPHESMLRAWLQHRFPAQRDIDDIVQEAYSRLLDAREKHAIDNPKAFLFTTARNLMLHRIRDHHPQEFHDELTDCRVEEVLDMSADVQDTVARTEELQLLTQAIQSLPTRCRQVLTLRKIYGLSQKEVAAELGISENTVEAHGATAFRKLAEFFERIERQHRHHP